MPAVDESARREAPGAALRGNADAIVDACQAMADRFVAGATLFAFGNAEDAQHVAVEFLHPVIVGKPALPAMAVATDGLRLLAKAGDIAVAVGADIGALVTARALGLLTIALVGRRDTGIVADHILVAEADDALLVRELHVTTYHLLWELTHVFLEQRSTDHCISDGHCVTCSDEAVEVTVVELRDGDLALVDTGTALEEVSVAFVDADVGARLLVHAKEAIARVE